MLVLVSDTSVLIDLERGGILRCAFELEAELVVPDVLFERELKGDLGNELLALGLRVESLTDEGVAQAQGYRLQQSRLTVPDTFALALARRNGWMLLSGDGALRALAAAEGVACHGVLWLIDQIEAESAATMVQLRDGLQRLAAHPRCRLPAAEVTARLQRYAAFLADG